MNAYKKLGRWVVCGALCPAALAQHGAALTESGGPVEPVVITGSVAERAAVDAPYAISVIDAATLRSSGPLVNLSEAMARVPGLVVANRNNYAQDLQISSRGFGARAGFGVRGLRLYTDGIPATMPDGQGQVSHFDLASAQRVEVLRGPFSVLYGNSSGGVIALLSAPVRERQLEAAADAGSFGLRQLRASVAAPLGRGFDVRASAALLEWEGFRPHSQAKKRSGAVRLGYEDGADRVVVQLHSLDQPAQDPLGLERAQFDADPYQTTPQATQYDTRKIARQVQLGASWRHRFAEAGSLRESTLMAYRGQRAVAQWLAIAAGTQTNPPGGPRHGGGVIDFDRAYEGLDARLNWRWQALDLVTGAALERQTDARRGYLNYSGTVDDPTYGVIGDLKRNETNRAHAADVYAQLEAMLSETLVASAGLRNSRVNLSTRDHFLDNGDDSGRREFSFTNPVLGLRWSARPELNLYASAARGFETPTLGELAYRTDGTGGFNTGLQPQTSEQFEAGLKWRTFTVSLDAALFRVATEDEIGIARNAGGRASFHNVGRTERNGAELALGWRWARAWRTQVSLTWLDATYRDGFLTCAGLPCSTPTVSIPAGNRIVGTQRGNAFAELVWQPRSATELALELRAAAATPANDSNTEFAPGYALLGLRAGQHYALSGGMRLEWLLRVDNLTGRRYAGSLIVNDANRRYFETGAPRNALLSLRLVRELS